MRHRVGGARIIGLWPMVATVAVIAGCRMPVPEPSPTTVARVPGESVIVARVLIPPAVAELPAAPAKDAVRITIQAEGTSVVRPVPLTPAGYLLASLPPGGYRMVSWEARGDRQTAYGPLDVPFDIPAPDRLYYLGTLAFEPQTAERYRLRITDQLDEAMRYLAANHAHLVATPERRLPVVPPR